MMEKRRKTLVFGTLAIAVVWGIWNNPFTSSDSRHDEMAEAVQSDTMMTQRSISQPGSGDEQYAVDEWSGDPFARGRASRAPASEPQMESNPSFRLSAVSESGGARMAVVNGRVVSLGDRIEGWVVSKIGDGTVTLADGEKRLTLSLAGK